jgi:hypothetical protein
MLIVVGTLEELKGRLEEVEQQGRETVGGDVGRVGLGGGGVGGRSGIPKRAVSVMSRVTG